MNLTRAAAKISGKHKRHGSYKGSGRSRRYSCYEESYVIPFDPVTSLRIALLFPGIVYA